MQLPLIPIPILVLLILLSAWMIPLLVTNIKNADIGGEPKTEVRLRKNFYATLFLTACWLLIYLIPSSRRDSSEHALQLLIVVVAAFKTFWTFRRWRFHVKNLRHLP